MLYAHGGGFVTGNLDTDHPECVELAREADCLVVSVDYRLAPEHPGAALVATLAQRTFDREGPTILAQVLHQPMLDADATPSRREFQLTPGLNGPAVSRAWAYYLGHSATTAEHVPAHRANLEGLPPAFISCAEIDPCREEAVDYANRLLHAYVHTELHVVAATFDGFDSAAPDWVVSPGKRCAARSNGAPVLCPLTGSAAYTGSNLLISQAPCTFVQ